jgi:hypothetical protein
MTLAGREDVLERFDVTMARLEAGRPDVAPLITGSRGMGKTVLLNELVKNAQERGWFVASEEVIPGTPLSTLIAVLAHEVLLEMSGRHRAAAKVRRALGVLKAFTAVSALGVSLSIDADAVTGAADTGIFSRDLRRLFIEIGELAREQSVGVAFALDEVHVLDEGALDDLNSALHQTAQRKLPVVFIGAGLFPSWQKSGNQAGDPTIVDSYPARMSASTYLRLEPLDVESSRRALADTALTEQVTFTDEALDAAVAICEGNPWMIQLVGSAAWEVAECSPIGLRDVGEAINRVRQQLYGGFFPRLVRDCRELELDLLTVIADHLDGSTATFQSPIELKSCLEDGTTITKKDLRARLRGLAGRDLIELDRVFAFELYDGYPVNIRFTVPMLGSYFRRPDLQVRPVALGQDATPPGHEAF